MSNENVLSFEGKIREKKVREIELRLENSSRGLKDLMQEHLRARAALMPSSPSPNVIPI
jgi:hypothetical protein